MRRLMAALTVVALAAAVAAPAAFAGTQVGHFACDEHFVANPDPGRLWIDEDLVLHVRGSQWIYAHVGDPYCAGDAQVTVNLNVDLLTGEGTLWGTTHVELAALEGGWDRTFVAHFTNPAPLAPDATDIWVGRFVGKGFGELAGWQIRGQGIERTHLLVESSGVVFLPGG